MELGNSLLFVKRIINIDPDENIGKKNGNHLEPHAKPTKE